MNWLIDTVDRKDIVFVAVTDEGRDVVEPFLKRKPIKGWVALDTDHAARDAYKVTGIPHTFIIGRDGRIKGATHPSGLTAEHIEKVSSRRATRARQRPGQCPPANAADRARQAGLRRFLRTGSVPRHWL